MSVRLKNLTEGQSLLLARKTGIGDVNRTKTLLEERTKQNKRNIENKSRTSVGCFGQIVKFGKAGQYWWRQ